MRRFASDDKLYQTDPNSVKLTMNWVRDPQPLLNEPGMHRFVWDLHHALPAGLHRSSYLSDGPWAVPGNYSVKLTANGQTTAQPLTVKMDPRSNASADALQHQLELASQLSKTLGQVSIALQQAKDLRKQIDEHKKDAAGKSEVLAALDNFDQKMEVAADPGSDDDFMLFGLALPDKTDEPLPRVGFALSALLIVEQSADVAPSADLITAAKAWDTSSQAALARWKSGLDQDLAALNSRLQKAGQKPLRLE